MDNITTIHNETYDRLKNLLRLMNTLAETMQTNVPHIPYRNIQFEVLKHEGINLCRQYNVMNITRENNFIDKTNIIHNNISILSRRISCLLLQIEENTVDVL